MDRQELRDSSEVTLETARGSEIIAFDDDRGSRDTTMQIKFVATYRVQFDMAGAASDVASRS
jgi:hypothetical protein